MRREGTNPFLQPYSQPHLGWLTAGPIAHRGLHDRARGIIENSPSAFAAAIEAGYAIECDLQRSADGQPMVFHDETLDRLTGTGGDVSARTAAELQALTLTGGSDHMQTLPELLDQVAGKVPLVIEIKSRFDGDMTLTDRAAALVADYPGPAALMSFDPVVIAHLAAIWPNVVRGIVADRMTHAEWKVLPLPRRLAMRHFTHLPETRPHFLSYDAAGLPVAIARAFRTAGRPVICWTIRSEQQAMRATRYCDQITFEGFRP